MGLFNGLVTGLLGGIAGALGQSSANAANERMADKQMAFQEEQSATAYQRATADMSKAGINPMLAYMKGGADSGGGAMGSAQNVGAAASSGAAAAMQARQAEAATEQAEAAAEKIQTENKGQEIDNKLKPVMAAIAAKNAASSSKQADNAATYTWYSNLKQFGKDMGDLFGVSSSAKQMDDNRKKYESTPSKQGY